MVGPEPKTPATTVGGASSVIAEAWVCTEGGSARSMPSRVREAQPA